MRIQFHIARAGFLLLGSLAALTGAFAAESDEIRELREELRALQQQVRVLARQIELKEEAAAVAPGTPKITVNDKGVTLASADAANSLRLRGLVQLDHRAFFNDGGAAAGLNHHGFVLRRARIIAEGAFAKNYTFQLVTEFGGSAVSILDANLGIAINPALHFKLGKFKAPIGLEQLQSDTWTFFNERSIANNLVPNRDLGITAGGDILGGRLNYTVGVLNGVADGASTTNADFDNEKDFVARLFVSPFKDDAGSPLQGLAFGVGASYGREKGTAGRTGGYRTDGQQTFFRYLDAVVTDGPNWRVSPQLDYRQGPFGLLGEYTISTVNVRAATGPKAELRNTAWQVAAGYVLTGENSSFNGVVPASNFEWGKGTWGAFEVTGRLADVAIDGSAFPLYASPSSSASEASAIGVGLNWYLSKAVAFKLDYYRTDFDFAADTPAVPANAVLRQDEHALLTRFQIAF